METQNNDLKSLSLGSYDDSIEIRIVKDESDYAAIVLLRNEVHFEKHGSAEGSANISNGRVCVVPDDKAIILGAFQNGRAIGTIQLNSASDTNLKKHNLLKSLTLASKLTVAKEFRQGTALASLCKAVYLYAQARMSETQNITRELRLTNSISLDFSKRIVPEFKYAIV